MKPAHIALIIASAGLILADIFWATDHQLGNTISEVMLKYALQHPIIPFAFGVLCGHLFWFQVPK